MRTLDRRPGRRLALALLLAALPFAVLSGRVSALDPCLIDGTTAVQIHDIQGAGHVSPCLGESVEDVLGVVTAVDAAGRRFWMQDPMPDGDDATSEGILVVVHGPLEVQGDGQPHPLAVGDAVRVSGVVDEFLPGNDPENLATTEIDQLTALRLDSTPASVSPTLIGPGGRVPPPRVVEDSAGGTTLGGAFEPAVDGLDFWESLEGMLVEVDDAVAVGPQFRLTDDDREPETLPVLAANGAGAGERTIRDGILISDGSPVDDQNPERIFLSSRLLPGNPAFPGINLKDYSEEPLRGVVDYSWWRYQLLLRDPVSFVSGGLTRETTEPAGANELTVATFNVENLDARDPEEKFDALAAIIVNNLRAPDLLVVEEVQDNNGPTNDSVVEANETADKLIAAIKRAGGPTYQYRDVAPEDDQDGGEPGGNIRQGFLFRTDRGLEFLGGTRGDATTAETVLPGLALSLNPGRIDPSNPAFRRGEQSSASRKPLVGAFTYNGHPLFVIGVHMNSKGPDDQLYGSTQPPVYRSEGQRTRQALVVRAFVDRILDLDANAYVIVLGDFNDYPFSEAVQTLADGGAANRDLAVLLADLPLNEQYSYVFAGNSQALDQMLVTPGLADALVEDGFDVVHVNAEFADQASDHDPQVARFLLPSVGQAPPASSRGANATPEVQAAGSSDRITARR